MSERDPRKLQRQTWWQGQMLRSRDLRDQVADAAQRRAWHNRVAHCAYGIGFGLDVTVPAAGPIQVACGGAIDCQGRELILKRDTTIAVPPSPSAVASYLLVLGSSADAAGGCGCGCTALHGSGPLVWTLAADFCKSQGVPLARFTFHGGLRSKDDSFGPPLVKAMRRPRLASGSTIPGNTPWETWDGGLKVRVDTSAAGFTQTPVYIASPVWVSENKQFSPAFFASVVDEAADSFTMQLLFNGIGRQIFQLQNSFAKAATVNFAAKSFTTAAAHDFVKDDRIARLTPHSAAALSIPNVAGNIVTLNGSASDLQLQTGRALIAASFPRTAAVTAAHAAIAVRVSNASTFSSGQAIVKFGGSATRIAAKLSGNILLLSSSLALANRDKVGAAKSAGNITDLDAPNNKIKITDATVVKANDTILRLSDAVETETVTTISSVAADGWISLAGPIDFVMGDPVGSARAKINVAAAANTPSQTVATVDHPKLFAAGDLVFSSGATPTDSAFVDSIDGSNVILKSILSVAAGQFLGAADVLARSTIVNVGGGQVRVGNAGALRMGDLVMRAGTPLTQASRVIFNDAGLLTFSPPLAGVALGDVIGAARALRTALVNSVSGNTVTVDDATRLRTGDTVARLDQSGGVVEMTIVDAIVGNVLTLRAPLTNLRPDLDHLAAIAFGPVATVSAIPATTQATLDDATGFQRGALAARLDAWTDASTFATLKDAVIHLDAWLDGLIPGDTVGFAGVSLGQNLLRFDKNAGVSQFDNLSLDAPSEASGQSVAMKAIVQTIVDQRASLVFTEAPADALLRPEQTTVSGNFTSRFPAAFAAYAQQQGLHICWVGCQEPLAPPPQCPGAEAPCPCKSST